MADSDIMVILGFVGTIICVMTPIVKLNTTITKLNTTLTQFQQQTKDNHKNLAERVTTHGKEIDDHEKRLTIIETQINIEREGE